MLISMLLCYASTFFQSENLAVAYICIKWVQLVLFLIQNLAGLQQQHQGNITESDEQRRSWANHRPRWSTLLNGNYLENQMLPQDPALNGVPDLNSGFSWSPANWQSIAGNTTYFRIQKNILTLTKKNGTIFTVLISEDVINFSLCPKCFPSPIPKLIAANWIYFPSS